MKKQYLVSLLSILLIAGAGNFLLTAAELAPYSYDLDYSEGFMLEDAQRLAETGELYVQPELENGFESVKYTPLYYFLLSGLGSFLGITFLTGRLLNIAATLGALAGIYLLSVEKTGVKDNLLPLIFLAPYVTVFTGINMRTDMVALAFSLTGLYLFTREKKRFALISFLLAFLTKQSFVAGVLASSFHLATEMDWRGALKDLTGLEISAAWKEASEVRSFSLYYLAMLPPILLVLSFWSDGVALQNIFAANLGGFMVRWDLVSWLHATFLPLFGLAFYYVYLYRDRLLGSY
ncbi:MAG: hypothetical protein SVS85_01245 [Candidatus Nanohaloarchaea archaeon]|nr:hypothetical protein [Candidatus Nanohaloarchaea archaeon]